MFLDNTALITVMLTDVTTVLVLSKRTRACVWASSCAGGKKNWKNNIDYALSYCIRPVRRVSQDRTYVNIRHNAIAYDHIRNAYAEILKEVKKVCVDFRTGPGLLPVTVKCKSS